MAPRSTTISDGTDLGASLSREPDPARTSPGDCTLTKDSKHFVYAHRGFQYALPVDDVLEIVQTPTLLPFHGAMRGALGNMVHRHYLLPVLDGTELCTSVGHAPDRPVEMAVVIKREGVLCALAVDRYVTIAQLGQQPAAAGGDHEGQHADETVSPEPGPATDFPAEGREVVESVFFFRDNSLIVLSTARLTLMVRRGFGIQRRLPEDGVADDEATEEAADSAWQVYVCARIGAVVLGIPMEPVIEVIEHYEVMPLFMVHPSLRGLINLRGQVLAVLDISQDLDLPPRTLEEISQFIVVRAREIEFALCVDKVVGQQRIRQAQIQSADSMVAGELTRYLAGVHQAETGPIFIISVAHILELPRLQPFLSQES